jgi:phosphopantothenoylcysteine decarboxylase
LLNNHTAGALQYAMSADTVPWLLPDAGSVAAIKVPQLCQLLLQLGYEVKVISTKSALYFFNQQQLPDAVGPIAGDEDEWHDWKAVGDPVMHIELRRWADVYVLAPLSANTLAKLANGMCDNLVTCVARAWDFKQPLLVSTAASCATQASALLASCVVKWSAALVSCCSPSLTQRHVVLPCLHR